MDQYKSEFIKFMLECDVLKFGDFVTKSGRNTPFFINTGFYRTGPQLKKLGEYYARAIHEAFGEEIDVLFGPAYKGIPLSVTAAIAYYELYGKELKYSCNRKEIKDHGDKGILLGAPISDGDRVVIIEDVTTAGTSIRETVPIIKAQGNVEIKGLCVSVDRQERGAEKEARASDALHAARAQVTDQRSMTSGSALDEIGKSYGFKTTAIVKMSEVTDYLMNNEVNGKKLIDDRLKAAIDAYYEKYGGK